MHARRVAIVALMAALALIFSYVEVLIPFNFGIPGVKLGIANIVVTIALYRLGVKYAASVNVLRVIIAGLLFNGLFGALYSLAGAVVSLVGMVILKKTNLFSVTGVSMAGGVLHNLGQLIVATMLIEDTRMFLYFPVLLFSGMITGILVGIVAQLVLVRLPERIS